MTDRQWRQLLERVEHQVTVPDLDELQRRGVRLRRIRIAAGAAAVAAAVAVGAAVATTSVTDQDSVPHPVDRPSRVDHQDPPSGVGDQDPPWQAGHPGLFTFPPVGAAPSTPEHGELVASWGSDVTNYWHYVYADGRLIWSHPDGIGWVEQRLTPEGVDLMRTYPRRNPQAWLPEGAWEDRELSLYVPSRYAIVLSGGKMDRLELSRSLTVLPASVQELFADATPCRQPVQESSLCFDVTTEEARTTLTKSLEGEVGTYPAMWGLHLDFEAPDSSEIDISFLPLLPHGEVQPWIG